LIVGIRLSKNGGDESKGGLYRCALSPDECNGSVSGPRFEPANVEARASRLGIHGETRDQRDPRAARHHLNERGQARRAKLTLSNARVAARFQRLIAEAVTIVKKKQVLSTKVCF
jgi:hypothetical protein